MFKDTGKITKLANATNLLVIKEIPHNNSTAFAKGMMYFEATRPTLNALKSPVTSGSGANFKKNINDANNKSAPNKTLIIVVANFIDFDF